METEFDNIEIQKENEIEENQIQLDFDMMMQSIANIQYNKELFCDRLKPFNYKIYLVDDSENTVDEEAVKFSIYFSKNSNFSKLFLWKFKLTDIQILEVFEKYSGVEVVDIIKELESCLN